MQLIMKREALQRELVLLQDIAAQKGTFLQVLTCIRMQATESQLILFATDAEVSMRSVCGDDAGLSISESGVAVVDAKRLHDYVKSMEGSEIALSTDAQGWLQLSSGASAFRLPGHSEDDFPKMPVLPEDGTISKVNASNLADLIERVGFAIAEGQSNKTLAGALMEFVLGREPAEGKPGMPSVVRLVATDGFRVPVAARVGDFDEAWDVLVPQKGLRAIAALARAAVGGANIVLSKGPNHLFAVSGNRTLSSLLLAGEFPAWKNIFQAIKVEKFAAIDTKRFRSAVSRAAMVLDGRGETGVKLQFQPSGTMHLEAVNQVAGGDCKEDVGIGYRVKDGAATNGDLTVRVNHRYLLDFLATAKSSMIRVAGTDGTMPIRLTDGDLRTDGFQSDYILMNIHEHVAAAPAAGKKQVEKAKPEKTKLEKAKPEPPPEDSYEDAVARTLGDEEAEETW